MKTVRIKDEHYVVTDENYPGYELNLYIMPDYKTYDIDQPGHEGLMPGRTHLPLDNQLKQDTIYLVLTRFALRFVKKRFYKHFVSDFIQMTAEEYNDQFQAGHFDLAIAEEYPVKVHTHMQNGWYILEYVEKKNFVIGEDGIETVKYDNLEDAYKYLFQKWIEMPNEHHVF